MELKIIQKKIHEIRGQKVMLDYDLAELYEVGTKVLNQSVKRNIKRFPIDFMFQLTKKEWESLSLQIENLNMNNRSQIVTGSQKHRSTNALPFVFTEQGVAMLSAILRSDKAINVSIAIMKAFVFLKQYALSHKDLTEKLKKLENKYNKNFADVYKALNLLLADKETQTDWENRERIGFKK